MIRATRSVRHWAPPIATADAPARRAAGRRGAGDGAALPNRAALRVAPERRLRPRPRLRDAGLALPAVMAVAAAVVALAGTWFESALTESRRTRALSDRMIAFHAADAALAACIVRLRSGAAPYLDEPASQGDEPRAWRRAPALRLADAFEPFASWPLAAQPPRCLIEAWRGAGPAGSRAYLVTARGVGGDAASVVWLQSQLALRDGRIVAQRWRRVVTVQ